MPRTRVAQQYVCADCGGIRSEYRALCARDTLSDSFELIPVELRGCHGGISIADIRYWRRAFRAASPDIIHVRGAGVESLNAVIAARLAGHAKVLVTVHGMFSDLVYYSSVRRWICRHVIEPLIFGLSDGISCVSQRAAERPVFDRYRRKMLPCVPNRMPTFRPPDPDMRKQTRDTLGIPPSATVGVCVGRVTREKGLAYLADALRLMDSRWENDLVLLLVGDGDYLPALREACAGLAHADRIVFAGQTEDVLPFLHASDFFLSCSLHENLSIAILEACAAGLPCLVTDVGGNAEIVQDGENGLIIPARSAEAIADGIRRMCIPALRADLCRRAAQVDYSRFSDSRVDAQLRTVYEKLLEGTGGGRKHDQHRDSRL